MRKDLHEKIDEIYDLIKQNKSKAYISRHLNCREHTLSSFFKKNGIYYKGNQGEKGTKKSWNKKSIYEYLKKDGLFITTHYLKQRLIKENIKECKCERCKREKWLGKNIPLELHHKDGNRYNNELENLEILCPNCHALEPNNSGKGVVSYKEKIKIKKIKKEKFFKILKSKEEVAEIRAKQRKVKERPSYKKLMKLINESSYVAVGKMFGVSDNAIRKWVKYYEKIKDGK